MAIKEDPRYMPLKLKINSSPTLAPDVVPGNGGDARHQRAPTSYPIQLHKFSLKPSVDGKRGGLGTAGRRRGRCRRCLSQGGVAATAECLYVHKRDVTMQLRVA